MGVESDLDHWVLCQGVVVQSHDTFVEWLWGIVVGVAKYEKQDAIYNYPYDFGTNYASELGFGFEANEVLDLRFLKTILSLFFEE